MKSPIVIAHRGASGYVPEHTLMAKGMAHAMGADFLEQDIVASKDGVPVVLHDIHLDTVSDVAKRYPDRCRSDARFYVIDFTLDELKQLAVYERFHPSTGKAVFPERYPSGEGDFRISTLAEELQFIQNLNRTCGREAGVYPEIKRPVWHRDQGIDLTPIVLDVLAKFGYTEKQHACYVQCFDANEVIRIRNELGYRGRLIQLIADGHDVESGTDYKRLKTHEGLAEVASVADGIGPNLVDVVGFSATGEPVVGELVAAAQGFGLLIHPWTFRADALPAGAMSTKAMLDACIHHAKVDGLFTDQPDVMVEYLR
ncbi:glycerophosphodiester phosphodiesterase [Neorhodopirellula pilleata]|uniref:glycerophosphodiester phosphodiesterase n=1 Tax=Neorhodopirellula pilleata TaxID=2714738 RepID=A0A5C6APG0_9BACT|nr:glycerophosphodiester phosphodiesterase [Neorhodopirellula pilleata]TWU01398.1 Glycerophosphoryl diester phosphodiesterase precursor [Neorhodopirellula pilleata]